MNEKISIIIPIYNAERYLERCLNSIVGQTLRNLEIILVNDGSTDKSEMICKNFALKDDRIRIVNIKKSGVSIARNIGINLSTGDWIGFIDADDWIERDMYEILYNNAVKYNVNISVCGYNRVFKYNNFIKLNNYVLNDYCIKLSYRKAIEQLIDNSIDFATANWNKLYKKDFIRDIRFDESITNGEDLLFNFYVFFKNRKDVIFDERKKYNYFFNEGSATAKKEFNKNILTEAKSWSIIYNKSLSGEYFYLNKNIKEHYINVLYYLIFKSFKTNIVNFKKIYIELNRNYINNIDFSNISYWKVFFKLIILKMIKLLV